MKQLAFSTDSHPNKYTRQRVWTSRNWFYSWVFSCLVTYLLVFRGVDEIGCHHFRKKRTTLDCLTIKLRNKENVRKIESTWGHDNKKLTGKRPLCCIFFLDKSYMRINLPERSQIWFTWFPSKCILWLVLQEVLQNREEKCDVMLSW